MITLTTTFPKWDAELPTKMARNTCKNCANLPPHPKEEVQQLRKSIVTHIMRRWIGRSGRQKTWNLREGSADERERRHTKSIYGAPGCGYGGPPWDPYTRDRVRVCDCSERFPLHHALQSDRKPTLSASPLRCKLCPRKNHQGFLDRRPCAELLAWKAAT